MPIKIAGIVTGMAANGVTTQVLVTVKEEGYSERDFVMEVTKEELPNFLIGQWVRFTVEPMEQPKWEPSATLEEQEAIAKQASSL